MIDEHSNSDEYSNAFLAIARTGDEIIIYAFCLVPHSIMSPHDRFDDIVLNEGWEPFDEVEIKSIPSTHRAGARTIFRGRR